MGAMGEKPMLDTEGKRGEIETPIVRRSSLANSDSCWKRRDTEISRIDHVGTSSLLIVPCVPKIAFPNG